MLMSQVVKFFDFTGPKFCDKRQDSFGSNFPGLPAGDQSSERVTAYEMRQALLCVVAAVLTPTAALRLPYEAVTRRSALSFGGAALVAVLPAQAALAETCLGKCSGEEERRKAERIAIQTGAAKPGAPTTQLSGVEGLIDMTIKREEAERGEPLSELRKEQIRAKIVALSPSEDSQRKGKVKARFRTE